MVMAAVDGIQNRIDPGPATDKDIQSLSEEELSQMGSTPDSLEEALNALESDHDFLLAGNVFAAEVIHYWIKYKRENEVDALRIRPHPYEFCMYFDI
jgi:glutamine synthetase